MEANNFLVTVLWLQEVSIRLIARLLEGKLLGRTIGYANSKVVEEDAGRRESGG